jgi:ankyrin repeat protein
MAAAEPALMELFGAIAARDADKVASLLEASPSLAAASVEVGATRRHAATYFLDDINHYVYAGDTALHIAAAAHEPELVRTLLGLGADRSARNRRGAEPLHYAADGIPGSRSWHRPHKPRSSPRSSRRAPIRMRPTRAESHHCTGPCAHDALPRCCAPRRRRGPATHEQVGFDADEARDPDDRARGERVTGREGAAGIDRAALGTARRGALSRVRCPLIEVRPGALAAAADG